MKNVFDERIVRDYVEQGKKLVITNDLSAMQKLYNKSVAEIPMDYCMNCEHDNLGSCYVEDSDKFRICFSNWLNNLENLLSD